MSDVRLDNDVVVSVFETNIRVLGYEPLFFSCCVCVCGVCISTQMPSTVSCLLSRGLLGAHVMADLLRERGERMQWYRDELLHMAKELGHRLLPAFNTTSGIPYPKVFLLSAFSHLALSHCSSLNTSSSLQTSQTCENNFQMRPETSSSSSVCSGWVEFELGSCDNNCCCCVSRR